MDTKQLGALIETFAPLSLQEDWDNCGYSLDLHNDNIERVLLCLDVTEDLIEEAVRRSCGVIISHHPLLFRKIRRIDSARFPGNLLAKLIKEGISVYCAHTSMDSAACGINAYVADLLGLRDVEPLTAAEEDMYKLCVTVPVGNAEDVRDALFDAGAGRIGLYSDCSFSARGTGTFRALGGAAPAVGEIGALTEVEEVRIETIVPASKRSAVLRACVTAHPYEEPAVDLFRVKTVMQAKDGLGSVGQLPKAQRLSEFAAHVKQVLDCPEVLVQGAMDRQVERVALCTGAGSSEISAAVKARADVFVTGEVKHNDMTDAAIPIIAAGHYDTEKWFVDAMRDALQRAGLEVQYNVGICMPEGMQRPYIVI